MSWALTGLVQVRDLQRHLGRGEDRFTVTIDRLDLTPGNHLALTGPSGCGKSTVLALLGLALRPDAVATFRIGATDAAALWAGGREGDLGRLRAGTIGFVPQTGRLLPFLTLRGNIALPLDLMNRPDPARIVQLAAALGITAVLDRRPAEVSIGQRQRAAVARAVIHTPAVILADEPTASVHRSQARAVLALLREVAAAVGAAMMIATHDLSLAEEAGFATVPMQLAASGLHSRVTWPC
ncbi:MAG TPA: ATP-binding cassette domain-containing protein [Rhodopila sp.]